MISFISKILVALNSNSRPGELASGIAFGFCLALIPKGNLLWIIIFSIAFLLKHNLAAMLLSLLLFPPLASLMDPLLHNTGQLILTMPAFQSFFTTLYNLPVLPWLKFNNTIVMGAFLWNLILWLPLFFLFRQLVVVYRKKVAPRLAESKLVKSLKKVPWVSKILSAYNKLSFLR
ncbi:MAG: TIGR03546 family protein [Spirochaetales bacterium]|nr:TIGR03546 family protein [Spirochaetales bacterium]